MNAPIQKTIVGVVVVILLGTFVVGALMGAAVYGWRAAILQGREAATLQNLKTIAAAEVDYFNTHNRTFGTFDQLVKGGMFTEAFAGERPIVDDRIFTLKVAPKTASQSSSYTLNVDLPDFADDRHFYIDSSNSTIHVNSLQPATASDPAINQ